MRKITLFILLLFATVSCEKAETETSTPVAINATNFPDANFRAYVSTFFDFNSDGILSHDEILDVKEIFVNGKNISSLKGVEHFVNLTSLNSSFNQLTTLDVSKNTALTSLSCYVNQLTTLHVSQKNTALTFLNCSYNQLTTLDVSKNTALTNLYCANNQITTLDVSKNTALTYLSCSANQLTTLDVSKNTALTDLSCDDNQLTTLDVSKNTALTSLWCYSNQLTTLDISKNTALARLDCFKNPNLSELKIKRGHQFISIFGGLDYSGTKILSDKDITWVD